MSYIKACKLKMLEMGFSIVKLLEARLRNVECNHSIFFYILGYISILLKPSELLREKKEYFASRKKKKKKRTINEIKISRIHQGNYWEYEKKIPYFFSKVSDF